MYSPHPAVSVVVSTYNRGELLGAAIEGVLNQQPGTPPFELILVDNNSTDHTRELVAEFTHSDSRIRYVFEPRQGLSYGRNAGIQHARGQLIAFTDDDVRPAHDWIAAIAAAFENHPDAMYIGGRVLPMWPMNPPEWLDERHWAPLALQDYGDRPFFIDATSPVPLVGANLSVRREIFDRVGLFSPELQRVKHNIGSTEDHEFQLRAWRAGLRALYAPDVVVSAEVQEDRLTKQYYKRWYRGIGISHAQMRWKEMIDASGRLAEVVPRRTIKGVPAYLWRQFAGELGAWVKTHVAGTEGDRIHATGAVICSYHYIRSRSKRD